MDILEVYADESCKNGHRYLAIGGIAIPKVLTSAILDEFQKRRAERAAWGEVKWTKLRSSKLHFYRRFVDVFFDYSKSHELHYHALYVDTSTADHNTYSEGIEDTGFDR